MGDNVDYDGSVSLDRKLTEEETRELRIILLPYFHSGSGGTEVDDITDFLDYTFAMISNQKSVEYVIKELLGMEMEFCPEDVAHKVGKEISNFIIKLNNGGGDNNGGGSTAEAAEDDDSGKKGPRVVSLKVC